MAWLNDQAKKQTEQFEQSRARGALLTVDNRPTLGIADIRPGIEIWTPAHDDIDPRGGIVLAVDTRPDTNDDGEILGEERIFRCFDPVKATVVGVDAFTNLAQHEINPDSIRQAETRALIVAIQRFARHVGVRNKAQLDRFDVDLLGHALRLAALVIGERT